MDKKIKICVLHTNNLFKCGLKTLLTSDMFEFIEYEPNIQLNMDILLFEYQNYDVFKSKITALQNAINDLKIVILLDFLNSDVVKSAIKLNYNAILSHEIDDEILVSLLKFINSNGFVVSGDVYKIINELDIMPVQPQKVSRSQFKDTHANLTQREYEVLKLVVNGMSNAQIAEELTISEHTAKAHVCNIIQKLVVDDRTQAAVKALREGII